MMIDDYLKKIGLIIIVPLLLVFYTGCGLFDSNEAGGSTNGTTSENETTTSEESVSATTKPTVTQVTETSNEESTIIYVYIETAMMYAQRNDDVLYASPVSIPAGILEGEYHIMSAARWESYDEDSYMQYALQLSDDFYMASALYFAKDINTMILDSYYEIGGNSTRPGLISMPAGAASWLYSNIAQETKVIVSHTDDSGIEPVMPKAPDADKLLTDPTDPVMDQYEGIEYPYYIYVEKGSSTITIFSADENGEYTNIIASYRTASGRTIGRTPAGTYQVGKKERWHEFAYPYDGGYAQFATYFYNNLMIHSPIYSDKNPDSMTTEFYHDIGDMSTAGCLRTLSEAAYFIYTYCREGTTVQIVNGTPKGMTSPDIPPIDPNYPNTDPTDPTRRLPVIRSITGTVVCEDTGYVNIRTGPGTHHPIFAKLTDGTRLTISGEKNGWYSVLIQGKELYVIHDYIAPDYFSKPFDGTHIAYIPPNEGRQEQADGSFLDVIDELVDIRGIDDRIMIDLKFAGDDNFANKTLYPNDICMLQKDTALKLKYAQDIFERDGYYIKIYDAYRPFFVQNVLFDIIKDPNFVADPKQASHHNRGAAIDMSIVYKDGIEVEFLTPVHTFSDESSASSQRKDPGTKEIFEYFVSVMEEAGFYNYEIEWWHFSDTNWQKYMVTDHDLSQAYIYDHFPGGE